MNAPWLSSEEIQALRANFSLAEDQDEHFRRCWSKQTCHNCLAASQCSWCPFVGHPFSPSLSSGDLSGTFHSSSCQTWSCVPNSHKIPLLAPAYDENVCPHWAERWELRTRPLGCQVSSITSITSIVSITSTLVFVLLVFLIVKGVLWYRHYHKTHPRWWRQLHRYRWYRIMTLRDGEYEPLLPGSWPGNPGDGDH